MKPSVVLIGSGNMAYHLAGSFTKNKVHLVQVYNRSQRGLKRIQTLTGVSTTSSITKLKHANIYILAVSDDAIRSVANQIEGYIPQSSLVAHTSGNQSMDVFSDLYKNHGVLYPLQSLRINRKVNFQEVPIFISANNSSTHAALTNLAKKISKTVVPISDKQRSDLHIPAVIVNNFVNHLYTLANDYCTENELEFSLLVPLMQETLDRVKEGAAPQDFQTGPAIRNDQKTISSHAFKLKKNMKLKNLYLYITRQIQQYHHENN